jgi:hypothetical protein
MASNGGEAVPVAHLHQLLIDALIPRMSGWKFVARHRHFICQRDGSSWTMHLAFVNHEDDFDVVVDVAVEFSEGRKSVCIVGAQLGNIAGVGQTRFKIGDPSDIPRAVDGILNEFQTVGIPFLERFSQPLEVLSVLRRGGKDASLISPIKAQHAQQIETLERLIQN